MTTTLPPATPDTEALDAIPELTLDDADILQAMRLIPGYIDITTDDFRIIYHLAHTQAVARLSRGLSARTLMRTGISPLAPATPLPQAARAFVTQGLKSLPVTDSEGQVLGILTETDVLRALGAGSILELLLHLLEAAGRLDPGCRDWTTQTLMTTPAITVPEEAGLPALLAAFRRHPGRAMPVVDDLERCTGLLLRKDFLTACHLEWPA
jgi:CBS domain-containing membrane protein